LTKFLCEKSSFCSYKISLCYHTFFREKSRYA
jgi:hypothetical protein